MKYYCLTIDKRYSNLPVIKNWYGKIEKENIREDRSYLLPQRELLELTENKNVFFPDVLVAPFFLVTDLCKEVISMYEPKTKYKQIVLLDVKTTRHQVYHLPILKRVNGITEQKQIGSISIKEEKLKVHEEDVKDLSIFQVDANGITNTIIRLDALESMLRRGAKGIGIQEVEIVR